MRQIQCVSLSFVSGLSLGACQLPGEAVSDEAVFALATPAPIARLVNISGGDAGPDYSVLMPSDLERQPAESVVSPEVTFEGNGISLRFGLNWDMPSCPPSPRHCPEARHLIDGREARSISVNISMPGMIYNRRLFYLFSFADGRRTYIDLVCTESACARAKDIINSIEFKP